MAHRRYDKEKGMVVDCPPPRPRKRPQWPIHSEALAVFPDEARDAQKDAYERGVPTEFDQEGRPIFTSQRHQDRFCREYGYVNRG